MPQEPAIAEALGRHAEIARTPCGDGDLVWRHWSPPRDAPQTRPVVLVHGGSGSWTHWIRTIPILAASTDVWAVDLPGLGDSDMPPEPRNPETCARILAAGLRQLLPATRRPHLVGFSFGAHVSTFAAIELGTWLGDLTIVGSSALGLAHPPDMATLPKERSTMTAAERREVHRRTLEILMIRDPARIDDEAIALQAANVARARFRSREFARSDDIKQGLARVTVPVNAVWGERDVLAYPTLGHVRAALATHRPDLVWRSVPDAGHWVMYEQAERFNATLFEVLGI